MKKQRLISVFICVLLLAGLLAGCKGSEENKDNATKAPVSSVAVETTSSASETNASDKKNDMSETKPAAQVPADTEVPAVPQVPSEPKYCNVIVDEETYTVMVGDTIDYVFNLKTPEALEDFQATTNYDGGMLELVDADTATMFPVAGSGVICNTEIQNTVKFNAVNISGMDFTEGGVLVTFRFTVLDEGNTAISTTLEYMDSVKGEPYVSDYKIVGDFQYSEEIK